MTIEIISDTFASSFTSCISQSVTSEVRTLIGSSSFRRTETIMFATEIENADYDNDDDDNDDNNNNNNSDSNNNNYHD